MNERVRITDEELLNMANVPVSIAAKILGISTATIYKGLRNGQLPFGFAVGDDEGSWTYHISPAALVKYRDGTLQAVRITELCQYIAEEIEWILDKRKEAAKIALERVMESEI